MKIYVSWIRLCSYQKVFVPCFYIYQVLIPASTHPSTSPLRYVYACNNPSESIIAKRRGYGTIVSHNVPPYGRAGADPWTEVTMWTSCSREYVCFDLFLIYIESLFVFIAPLIPKSNDGTCPPLMHALAAPFTGLYKQLITLRELLSEYREGTTPEAWRALKGPIIDSLNLTGGTREEGHVSPL